MVTEPALLLVTVMVLAALVTPIPVEEKVSVGGMNVSGAVGPPVPVPESAAICGLSAPLVVMASAPLIAPAEAGAKVTVMVHFAAAASEVVQVPPVME